MKVELDFQSPADVNNFVVILEAGAKALGFEAFDLTYRIIKSTIDQANNANLSGGTGPSNPDSE